MKLVTVLVWALTLCGGLITMGGLASLTEQLGVNSTPGFDFRLAWWYWTCEVFSLLVFLFALFVGPFRNWKPALVGLLTYVSLALTPWIQTTVDINGLNNVNATAAGLILVVVGNFLLVLLTAFVDNVEPARPAEQQFDAKV